MRKAFLILISAVALAMAGCSGAPGESEYNRGLAELKRGNSVRAKALLEKSIARRPGSEENALAFNYLGVANWKLGQYKAAQEAFEDSRRLSPTLVEPVYNLGVLTAVGGDDTRAIGLLEEAAAMAPADERPLEYMAGMYYERGRWAEARRMLKSAIERKPGEARLYVAMSRVDLASEGAPNAVATLMQALERNSRYAPALFNLAVIYDRHIGDPAHARSYYERYLKAESKGEQADAARVALKRLAKTPSSSPSGSSDGPFGFGPITAGDRRPHEPVTGAPVTGASPEEAVTAQDPEPRAPKLSELDVTIREAAARAERGELAGALDQLLAAAESAAAAGSAADQERALRAAASICYDEPRAHYELGQFLMSQGRVDLALRSFKSATTLSREFAPAHLALARAAEKTGEFDTAVVGLNAAVRIDPRNADAWWELARLLDEKVKVRDRAYQVYREFETRFPGDPRVMKATERATALAPKPPPPKPEPQPEPVRVAAPAESPPAVTPPPRVTPRPAPAPSPGGTPTIQPSGTAPRPVATVDRVPEPTLSVDTPLPRSAPPRAETGIAPARPPPPAKRIAYRAPTVRNSGAAMTAFGQGARYQQARNWESALHYYIRALENDDKQAGVFYNLGTVYTAMGDVELAKDAYLRTIALQPSMVEARFNAALLYLQTNDKAAALGLLLDVVRQKPDYAVAYYALGQIYAGSPGGVSRAKDAYTKFLQLAPRDPAAASVRQWLEKH